MTPPPFVSDHGFGGPQTPKKIEVFDYKWRGSSSLGRGSSNFWRGSSSFWRGSSSFWRGSSSFGGDHPVFGGGHQVFGGGHPVFCRWRRPKMLLFPRAVGARKKNPVLKVFLGGSWRILPPKAAENLTFWAIFKGKNTIFLSAPQAREKSIFEGIFRLLGGVEIVGVRFEKTPWPPLCFNQIGPEGGGGHRAWYHLIYLIFFHFSRGRKIWVFFGSKAKFPRFSSTFQKIQCSKSPNGDFPKNLLTLCTEEKTPSHS